MCDKIAIVFSLSTLHAHAASISSNLLVLCCSSLHGVSTVLLAQFLFLETNLNMLVILMAGHFHFKKLQWQKWIWLGKILSILFQCLVPKKVEQLFPWSIVATSIRSSISNLCLFIPPEIAIA